MNHELATLTDRVASLERANRRLRATLATGALLACAALWTAAAVRSDGDLKTTKLELVDGEGRTCAALEVDGHGYPRLALRDKAAKERLLLSMGDDDVTFTLRGANGQPRAGLSLDGIGLPHLLLSDRLSRPRMHLSVNAEDHANLLVVGDDGTIVTGLGIHDDGTPWVRPGGDPKAKGDGK